MLLWYHLYQVSPVSVAAASQPVFGFHPPPLHEDNVQGLSSFCPCLPRDIKSFQHFLHANNAQSFASHRDFCSELQSCKATCPLNISMWPPCTHLKHSMVTMNSLSCPQICSATSRISIHPQMLTPVTRKPPNAHSRFPLPIITMSYRFSFFIEATSLLSLVTATTLDKSLYHFSSSLLINLPVFIPPPSTALYI